MAKKIRLSASRPASRNGVADPEFMIQQGLALHNQGEFAKAKEIYEAVLKKHPKHFDAVNLVGVLAAQTGDFGAAVELFGRALKINPNVASAYNNHGSALMELKRLDEAVASYDKALGLKPDFAEAHYNRGIALMGLSRMEQAVAGYDKALALRPHYAEAYNNRGVAFVKLKRPDEALASYDRALALKPGYAEAHYNRGVALMELKRPGEALASYDKALALRPHYAEAHNNRGVALVELKRLDEALASCDRALALKPGYAEAHYNRGVALMELKRLDEALASCDRALALKPDYAEAYDNRSAVLVDLGRVEEALQNCDYAIALALGSAALHNSRAVVLMKLDRPQDAIVSCDNALALSPNYVKALFNRGNALKALMRDEEALQCFDQALLIEPESAEVLNIRGPALSQLGRPEEGLASIDKALALEPDSPGAFANRAVLLGELGRFDEADSAIRQAIALSPGCARLYYTLTETGRLAPDEPLIEAMEELAQDMTSLDVKEQVFLHFALATAFAKSDEERSFEHLLAGTALKRKQTAYDEAAELGEMERIRDLFTDNFIQSKAGFGDPSSAPVFIVGMPRSGSTLIEQILASHPEVFGAGELGFFARTLAEFRGHGESGVRFPDAVPFLSGEHLRQIGAGYAGRLKRLAPAAERISDKMLGNFRFAGLIHLALPNARIIHARRDPVDTCFSCFSKLFVVAHAYSYDLGELGRYYRAYDALMAHWRKVLPKGVVLEVQYEELVGDLEGQARSIVGHCGLEWDARCLDFHKTERQVQTASVNQVRQPLYKSSIGRARLLEAQLAPLREALQL